MSSSNTIIFVPGAWHTPEGFAPVVSQLQSAGYKTKLVNLASVGPKEHLKGYEPDVAAIRASIEESIANEENVMVFCHSYGGLPSSQAIKDLDASSCRKAGKRGGVTHFFLCTAFLIKEGTSLLDNLGGQDLPWFKVSADKQEINPDNPAAVFYNDLSEEESAKWVSKLQPFSYQCMHSKLGYCAWRDVPTTFMYCEKDAALPPFVQKMMVEETAKGVKINTVSLDASHSPFLSMPDETVKAIRVAAGETI